MVTFAEIAIVDYRLSFADQGKQTFVFRFLMQQTNGSLSFSFAENKWKLPFSVSSVLRWRNSRKRGGKDMETWRHGDGDMETWRHVDIET